MPLTNKQLQNDHTPRSTLERVAYWLKHNFLGKTINIHMPSATHERIKEREKEISSAMAETLEKEAIVLLEDGQDSQDPTKQLAAYFLIHRAQEVRQGETSLLSAMGLLKHVDD